jgi:hypothetical protein
MNADPPTRPTRPRIVPQAGPAAWRAGDLRAADWMIPLGAEHAGEIEAVLAALGGRAPASLAEAPLPALGAVLRQVAGRLDSGQGFGLLRGLPLERIGPDNGEAVLMALGLHLGRPVPQGPAGQAVQRVGSATMSPGSARWRFHAEAADIVALLTLRQPPEADPAMLVAAATVHNEMMKRDRAALETLYAPLPHLLHPGLEAEAADAVVELPVFSTASGAFVGRHARDAIEAAQRLAQTPRLTAAQVAALDLLDTICAEPGLALRLDVRPGDVLLYNPLQVWKRRAEGAALEGEGREAMRLLLLTPNSRALPGGMAALGEGQAPGRTGAMVGG